MIGSNYFKFYLSPSMINFTKKIKKKLVLRAKKAESFFTALNSFQELRCLSPAADNWTINQQLTVKAINQFPKSLNSLVSSLFEDDACNSSTITSLDNFKLKINAPALEKVKVLFDEQFTNKTDHNLHYLYAYVLQFLNTTDAKIFRILEIGTGSNLDLAISSMGACGTPGASAVALANYSPLINILTVDIDDSISIDHSRIKFAYFDQLEESSYKSLSTDYPQGFDLYIDDALHAPSTVLSTLKAGIDDSTCRFIILEDIPREHLFTYLCVQKLLSASGKGNLTIVEVNSDRYACLAELNR